MTITYTPDEIVRRGQERYEHEIRSAAEHENTGKLLAIDIETGEYAIANDSLIALDALTNKRPDAPVYILRIGFPTAVRLGIGRAATDPVS